MQQAVPGPELSDRHIVEWLGKMPMRLTRLRVNIARALLTEAEPPTAESLYRHLLQWDEATSLGSVYRILKEWEDAGLVRRHRHISALGNKAVYVINGKPLQTRAYIFRCTECGRQQRIADAALADQLASVCHQEGFKLPPDIVIPVQCGACDSGLAKHAPARADDAVPPSQPDHPSNITQ